MKVLTIILAVVLSFAVSAQRYKTTASNVQFFSETPLEDIQAVSESASSIIDIATREIVIVIPIRSFDFPKELMEEHFNENYLESDTYPRATFKGKIADWDGSDGEFSARALGELEIHGVTREVELEGSLVKEGKLLEVSTVFNVLLEDYKVKIPKAVFYKIAEEIEVTAKFTYRPYEKN